MKHKLSDRIRRGEPIEPPLSWLLSGATAFTRAGMGIRKLRPFVTVDADVISVGNITAGGTGKTPAVIRYAKRGIAANVKVGILTRGYGTPQETSVVVSTDIDAADHYRKLGDEPAVILRHAPEVVVFKAKDRVHAAQIAVNDHGCQVLILDDGYQYLHLGRNDNILLIDAENPFGNGHLLPRGYLREPVDAISRATHCIVTRCSDTADRAKIAETVRTHNPHCSIEWTRHSPTRLIHAQSNEDQPLDRFRGVKVVATCSIGNPEAFSKTLVEMGMIVQETRAYADHAPIPDDGFQGTLPVIVTEKDLVRTSSPPDNVYALMVELETLPD